MQELRATVRSSAKQRLESTPPPVRIPAGGGNGDDEARSDATPVPVLSGGSPVIGRMFADSPEPSGRPASPGERHELDYGSAFIHAKVVPTTPLEGNHIIISGGQPRAESGAADVGSPEVSAPEQPSPGFSHSPSGFSVSAPEQPRPSFRAADTGAADTKAADTGVVDTGEDTGAADTEAADTVKADTGAAEPRAEQPRPSFSRSPSGHAVSAPEQPRPGFSRSPSGLAERIAGFEACSPARGSLSSPCSPPRPMPTSELEPTRSSFGVGAGAARAAGEARPSPTSRTGRAESGASGVGSPEGSAQRFFSPPAAEAAIRRPPSLLQPLSDASSSEPSAAPSPLPNFEHFQPTLSLLEPLSDLSSMEFSAASSPLPDAKHLPPTPNLLEPVPDLPTSAEPTPAPSPLPDFEHFQPTPSLLLPLSDLSFMEPSAAPSPLPDLEHLPQTPSLREPLSGIPSSAEPTPAQSPRPESMHTHAGNGGGGWDGGGLGRRDSGSGLGRRGSGGLGGWGGDGGGELAGRKVGVSILSLSDLSAFSGSESEGADDDMADARTAEPDQSDTEERNTEALAVVAVGENVEVEDENHKLDTAFISALAAADAAGSILSFSEDSLAGFGEDAHGTREPGSAGFGGDAHGTRGPGSESPPPSPPYLHGWLPAADDSRRLSDEAPLSWPGMEDRNGVLTDAFGNGVQPDSSRSLPAFGQYGNGALSDSSQILPDSFRTLPASLRTFPDFSDGVPASPRTFPDYDDGVLLDSSSKRKPLAGCRVGGGNGSGNDFNDGGGDDPVGSAVSGTPELPPLLTGLLITPPTGRPSGLWETGLVELTRPTRLSKIGLEELTGPTGLSDRIGLSVLTGPTGLSERIGLSELTGPEIERYGPPGSVGPPGSARFGGDAQGTCGPGSESPPPPPPLHPQGWLPATDDGALEALQQSALAVSGGAELFAAHPYRLQSPFAQQAAAVAAAAEAEVAEEGLVAAVSANPMSSALDLLQSLASDSWEQTLGSDTRGEEIGGGNIFGGWEQIPPPGSAGFGGDAEGTREPGSESPPPPPPLHPQRWLPATDVAVRSPGGSRTVSGKSGTVPSRPGRCSAPAQSPGGLGTSPAPFTQSPGGLGTSPGDTQSPGQQPPVRTGFRWDLHGTRRPGSGTRQHAPLQWTRARSAPSVRPSTEESSALGATPFSRWQATGVEALNRGKFASTLAAAEAAAARKDAPRRVKRTAQALAISEILATVAATEAEKEVFVFLFVHFACVLAYEKIRPMISGSETVTAERLGHTPRKGPARRPSASPTALSRSRNFSRIPKFSRIPNFSRSRKRFSWTAARVLFRALALACLLAARAAVAVTPLRRILHARHFEVGGGPGAAAIAFSLHAPREVHPGHSPPAAAPAGRLGCPNG